LKKGVFRELSLVWQNEDEFALCLCQTGIDQLSDIGGIRPGNPPDSGIFLSAAPKSRHGVRRQAVAGSDARSYVWVLDKSTMRVHEQPVVILRPEGDNLVIDSGLKAGDTVVTAGAHVLSHDQHVTLYVEPSKR